MPEFGRKIFILGSDHCIINAAVRVAFNVDGMKISPASNAISINTADSSPAVLSLSIRSDDSPGYCKGRARLIGLFLLVDYKEQKK